MNPAAPSPSDSSIAQAYPFPNHLPGWNYWRDVETGSVTIMLPQKDLETYVTLAVEAAKPAPAAAVGGDEDSPTVSVDLWEAYKAWPEDLRKKLSMHDLRRMSGWKPPLGNAFRDGVAEQWLKSKATPAAPVGGFVVVAWRGRWMGATEFGQWIDGPCSDEIVADLKAHGIEEVQRAYASPAAQPSPHTTEDDYQHFLAYSGLDHTPLLQYAYYHGADVGMEKPKDAAQPSAKDGVRVEVEKLQAFKDYVHQRLDEAGIPTHPVGEHSAAGCRIGDRLDIALSFCPIGEIEHYQVANEDGSYSYHSTRKATTASGLVDGKTIVGGVSERAALLSMADNWYAGDGYESGIKEIDDATNNRWAAKRECAEELRAAIQSVWPGQQGDDDEERCEGGDPECGPVEFHDVEGVPLCRVCWEGLLADSANHPGEQS